MLFLGINILQQKLLVEFMEEKYIWKVREIYVNPTFD